MANTADGSAGGLETRPYDGVVNSCTARVA